MKPNIDTYRRVYIYIDMIISILGGGVIITTNSRRLAAGGSLMIVWITSEKPQQSGWEAILIASSL